MSIRSDDATIIERRDDLLRRASDLTDRSDASESDLAAAKGLLDQADDLNEAIRRSDESDVISDQLSRMGAKQYGDDPVGSGPDRGYPEYRDTRRRHAIGETVARKALHFARSVAGQKAIVAGGTITTPIALTPPIRSHSDVQPPACWVCCRRRRHHHGRHRFLPAPVGAD